MKARPGPRGGRSGRGRPPGRRSTPRTAPRLARQESLRAEVKALSRQVGEARKAGDARTRPRSWPTRAGASATRSGRPPRGRRPGASEVRHGPALPAQPPVGRGARRGGTRGQRGGAASGGRAPRRAPEPDARRAPAGAPLGGGRGARHPRHGPRRQAGRLDVPALPRGRGPAAAGAHRPSPSTATPTPTRRSGRPPWCSPRP